MYMQGNQANNSFVIPAHRHALDKLPARGRKAGTQNLNKKCRFATFFC